MTVRELRAEARRRGVKLPARARKAEIEELLGIGVDRSVLAGVERDLGEMARRDARVPGTALAASARALAEQLDDPEASATSKANCARALRETLERIEDSLPEVKRGDRLDELRDRRGA